jgi:hypothetical protein
MNRTIKEATVQRYHYENHEQLRQHLTDVPATYNFTNCLKALRGIDAKSMCLQNPHRRPYAVQA